MPELTPEEQQRKLVISKLEGYYPLQHFFQRRYSDEPYLSTSKLGMAGEIIRNAFITADTNQGGQYGLDERNRYLIIDSDMDHWDRLDLNDGIDQVYEGHNMTPFPNSTDDQETRGNKLEKMQEFQNTCLVPPEESMFPDDIIRRSTETQFLLGQPDASFSFADQQEKHEMRGKLLMFYIGNAIKQAGLDIDSTIDTIFELVRNGLEKGFFIRSRQKGYTFDEDGNSVGVELIPIPEVDDGIKQILHLGAGHQKKFNVSLPAQASESVLPTVEKRDVEFLDPFLYRAKGEPGYEKYKLMNLTDYLQEYISNIHSEMTGHTLTIANKEFVPRELSAEMESVESIVGKAEYKKYFSLAELMYHGRYGRLGKFRKYYLRNEPEPVDPRNSIFVPVEQRRILTRDDLRMQDRTVIVEPQSQNTDFMDDVSQYYQNGDDIKLLEQLGVETILYLGYMLSDYHQRSSMYDIEIKIRQYAEKLVPVLSKLSLIDSGGIASIDQRDADPSRRNNSVLNMLYLGVCMNRRVPFEKLSADLEDIESEVSKNYRKASLTLVDYGDLIDQSNS